MSNAFSKGEYIMYGKNGLCLIAEIKEMSFVSDRCEEYYFLEPVSGNKTMIYVPCKSEALTNKMRRVMTREEIDAILERAKGHEMEWIDDKKVRAEHFRKIVLSGNHRDMILMISCIYLKKKELESLGKKLWFSDETILNSTEKLIEEEFAFSLQLYGHQISSYIRSGLGLS